MPTNLRLGLQRGEQPKPGLGGRGCPRAQHQCQDGRSHRHHPGGPGPHGPRWGDHPTADRGPRTRLRRDRPGSHRRRHKAGNGDHPGPGNGTAADPHRRHHEAAGRAREGQDHPPLHRPDRRHHKPALRHRAGRPERQPAVGRDRLDPVLVPAREPHHRRGPAATYRQASRVFHEARPDWSHRGRAFGPGITSWHDSERVTAGASPAWRAARLTPRAGARPLARRPLGRILGPGRMARRDRAPGRPRRTLESRAPDGGQAGRERVGRRGPGPQAHG